jgi:hypothetical protein
MVLNAGLRCPTSATCNLQPASFPAEAAEHCPARRASLQSTAMRARVAVPLLLLMLSVPFATPARSDCTQIPVYSGQFRATIFDLAIDGTDLWLATGYGIALYDRSESPPAPVASIPLPAVTNQIRVSSAYAWAASGSSLFVLQKDGRRIRRVQRLDLGGTVNDLLFVGPYLFIAGSNGITQISAADPLNPVIVASGASAFPISTSAAFSLATDGVTLWVADGDSSIEAFNVSTPALAQRIGSFNSLPRATSVKLLGQRLLVSDGQQTAVLSGTGAQMVRLATLPAIASSALAPIDSNVAFAAGNGLAVSAVDFSDAASPVMLFSDQSAPSGGTVNRILKLASASGRLYAAGGDLGLVTWDFSRFASPWPIHSYASGGPAAVAALGTTVAASNGNGMLELTRSAQAGTLTAGRSWDAGHDDTVQDMAQGLVLTSAGAALTLWSMTGNLPAVAGTASLAANVRSAVLNGTIAWAVLNNQTLARVDMAATPPAVSTVGADGAAPSFIAGSGSALALADLNADGTTTIRYFSSGDPASTPAKVSFSGLATSGITLSRGRVAAFTFQGTVIVDFRDASRQPVVATLPQTRKVIPNQLLLDDSALFILAQSILQVWNIDSGAQTAQLSLPAAGIGMAIPESGSDTLIVGTTDGVATVRFGQGADQPSRVPLANGNSYYKKIAVGPTRLYAFDGSRIGSWALSPGGTPSDFEAISGLSGTSDLKRPGCPVDHGCGDFARFAGRRAGPSTDRHQLGYRAAFYLFGRRRDLGLDLHGLPLGRPVHGQDPHLRRPERPARADSGLVRRGHRPRRFGQSGICDHRSSARSSCRRLDDRSISSRAPGLTAGGGESRAGRDRCLGRNRLRPRRAPLRLQRSLPDEARRDSRRIPDGSGRPAILRPETSHRRKLRARFGPRRLPPVLRHQLSDELDGGSAARDARPGPIGCHGQEHVVSAHRRLARDLVVAASGEDEAQSGALTSGFVDVETRRHGELRTKKSNSEVRKCAISRVRDVFSQF